MVIYPPWYWDDGQASYISERATMAGYHLVWCPPPAPQDLPVEDGWHPVIWWGALVLQVGLTVVMSLGVVLWTHCARAFGRQPRFRRIRPFGSRPSVKSVGWIDPQGRQGRIESALIVVRSFGTVAAVGLGSFGLFSATATLGAARSIPVFVLYFVIQASGILSVVGAFIGVLWAGPRARWALGREGFAWLGGTAVLATLFLLWPLV